MKTSFVKSTFPVAGMSCAACAISIESMLSTTNGVQAAGVNYANQTAWVEYNTNEVSPAALQKAVQSIGYDLIISSKEGIEEVKEGLQQDALIKIRRQTIGALVFAVPVAILGMFFMDFPYVNYLQLALAAPVLFGFGAKFFVNAYKQLWHRTTSMDTLVAVSTGVAFLFSVFNTFFPEFWHVRGIHPHVYFEAASIVIAFVSLGKWMEEKAKSGTSEAIKKLIGLQAKTVRILTHLGEEREIEIALVNIEDKVVVKSGEKIPVDGVVEEGTSFVDESTISGEPLPTEKIVGSKVYAGTINQQGLLTIVAKKVGSETVVAHIIQMVQEAQGSKAPVQKLVDKIAGIFVPIVLVVSVLTFGSWMLLGGENAFSHGLMAAVTVLVIACPCALGLATPTAIMVGIGKGAESNILIKDAESLERAHQVTSILVDKTGTLTEGKPSVQQLVWKEGEGTNSNAALLRALEAASTHPLAFAVAEHLKSFSTEAIHFTEYTTIPGKGIAAVHEGSRYFVGNISLLKESGVEIPNEFLAKSIDWQKQAYTLVYFANEKTILAIVAISDALKETSKKAVVLLQQRGIHVYMLTGDTIQTAAAVAKEVGILQYKAQVLPSEKADFVKELQLKGEVVAMIGDGINDSHALAQADVSIAMGKGSDIAIDVAKMTLLTSDLLAVPKAFTLSSKTVRTIRQNLFWAFIYNVIGIPVAAGILYPLWGILLDPMLASAAMALSSVSVVSNSLRLKWASLD